MLTVLEGLDGAGKSTQVRRLRTYLESHGGGVEYIHFPCYDSFYGELIGKYLRGGFGSIDEVHPQLAALLYAEDRRIAGPRIKQALADGKTVLLDRYVCSNIAFQCAKLPYEEAEELREWILNTEFDSFNLPRPDLSIVLDVPLEFVEASLASNRAGDDRNYLKGHQDIHEADIEYQKKVRAMYLRQASLDPSIKVVDCSDSDGHILPPDAIFAKLKVLVDECI